MRPPNIEKRIENVTNNNTELPMLSLVRRRTLGEFEIETVELASRAMTIDEAGDGIAFLLDRLAEVEKVAPFQRVEDDFD